MFESGAAGRVFKDDIKRHVSWTLACLSSLGILAHETVNELRRKPTPEFYTEVHEYTVSSTGSIWTPRVRAGQTVSKGEVLGTLLNGKGTQLSQKSRQGGTILWNARSGEMISGDTLAAIAR
jgi:predicted deacylase